MLRRLTFFPNLKVWSQEGPLQANNSSISAVQNCIFQYSAKSLNFILLSFVVICCEFRLFDILSQKKEKYSTRIVRIALVHTICTPKKNLFDSSLGKYLVLVQLH